MLTIRTAVTLLFYLSVSFRSWQDKKENPNFALRNVKHREAIGKKVGTILYVPLLTLFRHARMQVHFNVLLGSF